MFRSFISHYRSAFRQSLLPQQNLGQTDDPPNPPPPSQSLTITQFQQLASKQLQLESQMQHFVAKCDPSAKKGRVKLPCETKLTELQEEVTTLRQQVS